VAGYYSCTCMWDMGTQKVITGMNDAKVYPVNTDPQPLDTCEFVLRASSAAWPEFASPIPAPMYHGIWSASFRRDLKMEGKILVPVQNLRNFIPRFELLRKVGVPV